MKQKKTILYLCLTALVLLTGCAVGSEKESYAAEPWFGEVAEAPMERDMMKSSAPAARMENALADEAAGEEGAVSSPDENAGTDRKRIYNGSAGLIVDDRDAVRKELETLALKTGGYIESSYADYLVLRIPAEEFNETFEKILLMGTVDFREISSWDVTDRFSDLSRRLDTALKTRERLYALLERTKDAEERAAILREIGRLSEEIEALKQQKELLESRIAFSRITVSLIPRLQEGGMDRTIPFGWIASLDPLYPVSDRLRARVVLDPGEEFAVFDRESVFMAEDAEGNSLFISSIDNHPQGDGLFWQEALLFHLKDYYADAEPLTISMGEKEFSAVRFTSRDREPFAYTVGVLADGDDLHVLELFAPAAEKDLSALMNAIEGGQIR
jgi:hypothetical protein